MTVSHPAADLPGPQRLDYLRVLAVLCSADGDVSEPELDELRELSVRVGLAGDDVERVVEAARSPSTSSVGAAIQRLRDSDLRFTLVADLCHLAHADGEYSEDERGEIAVVSQALGVSLAQFDLIRGVVDAQVAGGEPHLEALDGMGIPAVMVTSGGTGFRETAPPVTPGLAALGDLIGEELDE